MKNTHFQTNWRIFDQKWNCRVALKNSHSGQAFWAIDPTETQKQTNLGRTHEFARVPVRVVKLFIASSQTLRYFLVVCAHEMEPMVCAGNATKESSRSRKAHEYACIDAALPPLA